jgi:hypothetical protein
MRNKIAAMFVSFTVCFCALVWAAPTYKMISRTDSFRKAREKVNYNFTVLGESDLNTLFTNLWMWDESADAFRSLRVDETNSGWLVYGPDTNVISAQGWALYGAIADINANQKDLTNAAEGVFSHIILTNCLETNKVYGRTEVNNDLVIDSNLYAEQILNLTNIIGKGAATSSDAPDIVIATAEGDHMYSSDDCFKSGDVVFNLADGRGTSYSALTGGIGGSFIVSAGAGGHKSTTYQPDGLGGRGGDIILNVGLAGTVEGPPSELGTCGVFQVNNPREVSITHTDGVESVNIDSFNSNITFNYRLNLNSALNSDSVIHCDQLHADNINAMQTNYSGRYAFKAPEFFADIAGAVELGSNNCLRMSVFPPSTLNRGSYGTYMVLWGGASIDTTTEHINVCSFLTVSKLISDSFNVTKFDVGMPTEGLYVTNTATNVIYDLYVPVSTNQGAYSEVSVIQLKEGYYGEYVSWGVTSGAKEVYSSYTYEYDITLESNDMYANNFHGNITDIVFIASGSADSGSNAPSIELKTCKGDDSQNAGEAHTGGWFRVNLGNGGDAWYNGQGGSGGGFKVTTGDGGDDMYAGSRKAGNGGDIEFNLGSGGSGDDASWKGTAGVFRVNGSMVVEGPEIKIKNEISDLQQKNIIIQTDNGETPYDAPDLDIMCGDAATAQRGGGVNMWMGSGNYAGDFNLYLGTNNHSDGGSDFTVYDGSSNAILNISATSGCLTVSSVSGFTMSGALTCPTGVFTLIKSEQEVNEESPDPFVIETTSVGGIPPTGEAFAGPDMYFQTAGFNGNSDVLTSDAVCGSIKFILGSNIYANASAFEIQLPNNGGFVISDKSGNPIFSMDENGGEFYADITNRVGWAGNGENITNIAPESISPSKTWTGSFLADGTNYYVTNGLICTHD